MPKANVNGVNLYYKVHGRGEPLVLVMGMGGGHQGWFFQTRALKEHYQVISFDSRGIGRSDRTGESFSLRTMADDAVALMDHLLVDKAHIMGQSLGGIVAQEIAINYPERVMKMVLGSTTAGGRGTDDTTPEMLRAIGVEDGASEVDIGRVDFENMLATLTELSFNKRLYRAILMPLSKRYARSVGVDGLIGQFEAASGLDTLGRLHLIEAPTLVITGTEDRIVNPSASEAIARRIPNARLVKVEGGSHAFHIEMRGVFNREVLHFLRHG